MSFPRSASKQARGIAIRLAAFVLAVAILCLPAIWNRFPLVFDDVGGYLERWPTGTLGIGRSAAYGLLLWLGAPLRFIPVVLVQAVVTGWTIGRALTMFRLGRTSWSLALAVAAIAATSGAALFVSRLMPDAWAAPAVLAFYLLAWHLEQLTGVERAGMAAIVAFAGASHMATFGVLSGLSIVTTLVRFAPNKFRVAPPGLLFANASAWSGIVVLLLVDIVVAGRVALTPGGDAILFGHLVETGMVGKMLEEECPREDWRLCADRDRLPSYSEAVIWGGDSPIRDFGGWDDPRVKREVASIIARSVVAHPLDHLKSIIALAAEQFLSMGTADGVGRVETPHLRWTLATYAPWLVAPYDAARQQQEETDLQFWSDWVVSPVSILGTCALPLVALLLWRRGLRRAAMLPATIFLALVGNAFICGGISGPNDRYQARLAWLAPFAVAISLPTILSQRGPR